MLLSQVLTKSRAIAAVLHDSTEEKVAFNEVCSALSDAIDSDCFVLSRKGKILGTAVIDNGVTSKTVLNGNKGTVIDKAVNDPILLITATKELTKGDDWTKGIPDGFFVMVVPIVMKGIRIGTLIVSRDREKFEDEDIILAEYAATVVGLEMENSMAGELAEENRKISTARASISSLSDDEVNAAFKIFEELSFMDGVVLAGNVAEKSGIPITVLVGALRKFEKAGLIQTKSSGMKGTYIHILNDAIIEEIQKAVTANEG